MTNSDKYAYRRLLYRALVEIRAICLNDTTEQRDSREGVEQCRALADWTHNLALFSASDFEGFNPDIFWREHGRICEAHPQLTKFRQIFEDEARRREGAASRGSVGWGPIIAMASAVFIFQAGARGEGVGASHPPTFGDLKEAVLFISDCASKQDVSRLSGAVANGYGISTPEQRYGHLLDQLGRINQGTPLTQIYDGREFPEGADTMTLGGHNKELGHIHILFRKQDEGWVLWDLGMCR